MRRQYLILAAVSLAAFVIPLFTRNNFHLDVLTKIGIYAIAALGLNLLMGYAGQISMGHAAFFGIGAFASMVLTSPQPQLEDWLKSMSWMPAVAVSAGHALRLFTNHHMVCAALLAAAFTGVVAYLLGTITLRLRGHYLALATLGLGIIIVIVFKEEIPLTGGPSGSPVAKLIIFDRPQDPQNYNLFFYYLTWTVAAGLIALAINLVHSRLGRALRAIHADELAASASGIPVMRLKLTVFTLSAVYASIAGSLFAHYQTFVSPASFDFMASVKLVIMVVIGGMGNIWGAFLGSALLYALPQFLTVFENYEMAIFGLIMIVMMMLAPKGLAGLAATAARRLEKPK
jgi:branched-chain amino acid transport system permease protein